MITPILHAVVMMHGYCAHRCLL